MKRINKVWVALVLIFFALSSSGFAQVQETDNIKPQDAGSTISLDFKGMDIVEALKILAEKGNMNIVIGGNVKGKITMFLQNISVEDAFALIVTSSSLACDVRNGSTYIMTDKEYEQLYGEKYDDRKETKIVQLKYAKAQEAAKTLGQMKTGIGKVIVEEPSNTIIMIDSRPAISRMTELLSKIDAPVKSRIFELRFANTKDIKDRIQEMLTKGVGTIEVDERTNKVFVTDIESNLDRVAELVSAFDERQQQVLIEAKIMEITLDDVYKLGVDWQGVFDKLQRELSLKSAFKLATAGTLIPGAELIVGTFSNSDFAVMVQILKTLGDTNTLSNPRITAMNNQEAKILVGTNQPYATNTVTQGTATTTTATNLTFIEIGVKLYVTPTINRDGFITIKLRPEISSQSGTYTYGTPATTVPIVSTTHAETSVMVKDGSTIIIAGLIKDDRSSTVNKIPVLGDIPLLGVVFQNTSNEIKKKELVIFLTPHIISGETNYLKVPDTPPIGEKKFTMPNKPTFTKRDGVPVSADYLRQPKIYRDEMGFARQAKEESPENYFALIKGAIMENIAAPDDGGVDEGDKVKVSFLLTAGGGLASRPKILESTSSVLSAMAVDAVEKAAPFPPFPESIRVPKRRFELDIVY